MTLSPSWAVGSVGEESATASLLRMSVLKSPATVLAAFAVCLTAAPAHAATDDHRDAARDVVSRSLYTDAPPKQPEPARRLGDIVKSSVAYGDDLVVTTRFRSLPATGHQEFSWFVLPSDGEDDGYWTASLVVEPGKDKGRLTLLDPIANQPGCAKAVVDRAARTVTLTIPSSCLGDPAWVRVSNGVRIFLGPEANTREYSDDARRDGVVRDPWKYGPKVTRG